MNVVMKSTLSCHRTLHVQHTSKHEVMVKSLKSCLKIDSMYRRIGTIWPLRAVLWMKKYAYNEAAKVLPLQCLHIINLQSSDLPICEKVLHNVVVAFSCHQFAR